jgi:hypothetical protein
MQEEKFNTPCRVNFIPSPYEPDEDGVLDIGYRLGRLRDGRAYRLECWRMDALEMVTLMFSEQGLEECTREEIMLLVRGEELLRFEGSPRVQAARVRDDVGQGMWSVNLALRDGKRVFATLNVELNRYK